jgi:excisionase family DNA binding protein
VRVSAPTRTDSPTFLSVAEVAARLGVGVGTVRRWIASGHLGAIQPAGEQGVIRIPVDELERLAADARQVAP